MTIGEKYKVKPEFSGEFDNNGRAKKKLTGEVVYVHPEGRFSVLEFRNQYGAVRESFWPEDLEGHRVR